MRVLLVEDEPMISMLLCDMVESAGHEVAGEASSVDRALEMVAEVQADAAIVDLRLHNHDSYGVMQRLREKGIPFAVASGFGADIDRELAGTDVPIVSKPYSAGEVANVLTRLAG
ncbi:response regulator [Croceibacterium sp. TMG7-5b_MA50]|uniref:response regulator n=1 Tax=Croceibacterium sp. TMG7-5b_MA50 TaxID=3121290 RepID=UPI0032221AF3